MLRSALRSRPRCPRCDRRFCFKIRDGTVLASETYEYDQSTHDSVSSDADVFETTTYDLYRCYLCFETFDRASDS
ncbi:hypothetical protein [Natronocalculus amylovorans]|uniref:Uncharacterized protein n=1 Tax=Natronocalculus amylovorans TaxID=2917812 RepID=A0AAE3K7Y9_9EURY|nr:hypothetical protein [Natronocalculus amylovorans]MCL9815965.1 hypothetical protein [Natronocalculus amylovorans]NUE01519.1 hypothetical protein [Halorubraceae archaeon YAN]